MAISITKPTVGGSEDTWGTTINTALDAIVDEINNNADGTNSIAANLTEGSFEIGGTAVTATAAEVNILDGDTSATSTTLVDADRLVVNDNGVMKQVAMSDVSTYIDGKDFHPNISAASSVNNSGNTVIQDITLDDDGHITGLTSTTITSSTASDIAGLAYGAVGTYVWGFSLRANSGASAGSAGTTISGSHISPAGFYFSSTSSGAANTVQGGTGTRSSSTLSGTWRVMGHEQVGNGYSDTHFMTLFLRIS